MYYYKIILSIFLIYYVIGVIVCINELLKDRDLTFTELIGILLAYCSIISVFDYWTIVVASSSR